MNRRLLSGAAGAVLALAAAGVAVQLTRPVPAPRAVVALAPAFTVPGTPLRPTWPGYGEAAVGLAGVGSVGETAAQVPVPIASVTKLMTALVAVRAHPLAPGSSGPLIPITPADQALYQQERAVGDSVVAVRAGESLTEMQVLEGLLLPSADNLAQLLAVWTAADVPTFVRQMNREARTLGMSQSHFADSSGIDPGSRSTPADLLRLSRAVMSVPALAAVARMPAADLPVAGTVRNLDFVLGQEGIVGLKTGWTSSAGGCFVAAAERQVGGRTALLLAAVLGAPGGPLSSVRTAEAAVVTLLGSVWPGIRRVSPLPRGDFAQVRSVWARPVALAPGSSQAQLGWPGLRLRLSLERHHLGDTLPPGSRVAQVRVTGPDGASRLVPLRTRDPLPAPSLGWRLLRL